MAGRTIVSDPRAAAALGIAFFGLGWLMLHDAYEGHGREQPRWLRPFTWW